MGIKSLSWVSNHNVPVSFQNSKKSSELINQLLTVFGDSLVSMAITVIFLPVVIEIVFPFL